MSAISPRLIVHGCTGKLGSRIVALSRTRFERASIFGVSRANAQDIAHAMRDDDAHVYTRIARDELPARLPRDQRALVLIDVTSGHGADDALTLAKVLKDFSFNPAILICSTGLSDAALARARALSAVLPVLVTPNTSLGVTALAGAATSIARALGPDFVPTIIEAHHAQKKDAPSGTALRLARALSAGGIEVPPSSIHALRGGDVIGEHTIRLTGPGEVIELTHRATTRDLFAWGALRCAQWLAGRPPGFYAMESVLEVR